MRVAAGLFVLVALGSLAVALLLAPGPQMPAVHGQVSSNAVEDGRLLYIRNCAACHGMTGQGSDSAPGLASAGQAGLDFYMRTGRMPLARPGTPSWEQPPQLSQDQIAAILGYALAFSQGPAIPNVGTSQDVSRGWSLYLNNCAACHGAAGGGGSVGSGVTAPDLHGRDATVIAEAMLIGPGTMPRFAFAQRDQDAIVAYIESLDTAPAPGGFPLLGGGPVVEGALAAVLGVAALIVISMWVARRTGEAE